VAFVSFRQVLAFGILDRVAVGVLDGFGRGRGFDQRHGCIRLEVLRHTLSDKHQREHE
jgi:hypothetical protein